MHQHTSLRDILKNEDADAKKVEELIRAGAPEGFDPLNARDPEFFMRKK